MRQLFYFNGFNTAIPDDISTNAKISAVAEYCARREYEFIPATIDYRGVFEHRDALLRQVDQAADEVAYCGTSMGGWFGRVMQLTLRARGFAGNTVTLAFNPAFNIPAITDHFPGRWENFVTFEQYEWTAADSRQLVRMDASVNYDAPCDFYVYVDKGDEVFDWKASAARHSGISRFVAFEGGFHSFAHFNEALEDFDEHR